MNDELGQRMKSYYEDITRDKLPRRTHVIIRVDGKAFHTFTKGYSKPFDKGIMDTMDFTAIQMCKNIQGCVLAYTQSDEISLLLTDFETLQTDAWMDNNVQKMTSIAASLACAYFNQYMNVVMSRRLEATPALFDARVFTIPEPEEVVNYFIWRQVDAVRNSVQMAAQSVYKQKELQGKKIPELHEMLFKKGINWNNYSSGEKRGRAIIRQEYTKTSRGENATRHEWVALTGSGSKETPTFTQDRNFILGRIPEKRGKE